VIFKKNTNKQNFLSCAQKKNSKTLQAVLSAARQKSQTEKQKIILYLLFLNSFILG